VPSQSKVSPAISEVKPEWELRIVGERDLALSGEAYRLLCRILSDRSILAAKKRDSQAIWAAHGLTWTQVAMWTGCAEREAYRRIAELESRGYLAYEGVIGCPGQAHYRLVAAMAGGVFKKPNCRSALPDCPRTARKGSPRAAKDDRTRSASEDRTRSARKERLLTKYSLREEMSNPRGRNSSLRSKGTKGVESAASPTKPLTESQRKAYAAELARLRTEKH
jgi:hypothetical protein